MLSQLLSQEARARLNTLKISKPEKAEIVRYPKEPPDGLIKKRNLILGRNELDQYGTDGKNRWKD